MTKEELLNTYFYIQDESGTTNTIKIAKYEYSSPTLTLSYTTTPDNSSSWTSFTITATEYKTISLPANSKVYFKGTQAFSSSKYNYITCTYNYSAGGNVMSLLYGDNFKGQTTINSSYAFAGLFYKSTTLVTAKNLCLPAMTLANNCYMSMFNGCTNLTEVPELPATTLVNSCYVSMFQGCTSLTTAPELPATTLAQNCYSSMFSYCTNLTTAPELPATTLAEGCYGYMFYDCSSLTEIYAPNISTWDWDACKEWVNNVADEGTMHFNTRALFDSIGGNGNTGWSSIPGGWTAHIIETGEYIKTEWPS